MHHMTTTRQFEIEFRWKRHGIVKIQLKVTRNTERYCFLKSNWRIQNLRQYRIIPYSFNYKELNVVLDCWFKTFQHGIFFILKALHVIPESVHSIKHAKETRKINTNIILQNYCEQSTQFYEIIYKVTSVALRKKIMFTL